MPHRFAISLTKRIPHLQRQLTDVALVLDQPTQRKSAANGKLCYGWRIQGNRWGH